MNGVKTTGKAVQCIFILRDDYKNYKDQTPMLVDPTLTRINSNMMPERGAIVMRGRLTIAMDRKVRAK